MGVEDKVLSIDYGVDKPTIRMRRMREGWMTPAKIQAQREAEAARMKSMKRGNGAALAEQDVTRVTRGAIQTVAEQILKLAERNGLRVAQMSDRALRGVAQSPPEIESWGDVMQAYKALRLAAGVDKEGGTNVLLNLGAFWQPSPSGVGGPGGQAGQDGQDGAKPVDSQPRSGGVVLDVAE